MDIMEIVKILMWAITGLLVPSVVWVVGKLHQLELTQKEKIERDEAATMIANATHGLERKLDKIYDYILENKK